MANGIAEGFFAGGFGRGIAQSDPVGKFFGPIERAIERRQRSEIANRELDLRGQAIAQRGEEFTQTIDLQRQELAQTIEGDRQEAAIAEITPTLERMKITGQLIQQAERQGTQSVGLRSTIQADVATLEQLYQRAGRDPAQAQRDAMVAVGQASLVSPADTLQVLDQAAKTMSNLLDGGMEPAGVAAALDSLAQQNPQAQRGIEALKNALPASQQARAVAEGERDIAQAQPTIDALVAQGVQPDTAALAVLGNVALQITPEPNRLSDAEMADLRGQSQTLSNTISSLESVRGLINADTVGVWGSISENFGGIGQQIPVVRNVLDAVGRDVGLSEDKVTEAITSRNQFRFVIGQLAEFITQKGSRLSNQDREFVQQATGLLDTRTTPQAAVATVDRLLEIARRMEGDTATLLNSGTLASQPAPQVTAPAAPTTFATEADIPEGARVRDRETGETKEMRGGQLVVVPDVNEAE